MAAPDSEAEKVNHPVFAAIFGAGSRMRIFGQAAERRELVDGLDGRVMEVGCGAGVNFQYYPESVTHVLAIEPESLLRKQALKAAARAPVPVEVIDGLAETLPADDSSFDAVVVSLVLCSVRNPPACLAEFKRVLRPGGELRYYEHVLSRSPLGSAIQRGMDSSGVWPLLAGGCHCSRDTGAAIRTAGFQVIKERHLVQGFLAPIAPQIIGRATPA